MIRGLLAYIDTNESMQEKLTLLEPCLVSTLIVIKFHYQENYEHLIEKCKKT